MFAIPVHGCASRINLEPLATLLAARGAHREQSRL